MFLSILKPRPKPNLNVARRKLSNGDESNGNEINKSQPDKLSKREEESKSEEEVKTPFGESPTRIPSDSKSPYVSNGSDASEQANSSIICNLSERSSGDNKITQSEKNSNTNEPKAEMSAKKEIALSETVSDRTQKPDTETKLSTDVGGNGRKLKVRPKPNIGSINNRRRACPPPSESEENNTISLPVKPISTSECSNGGNNPFGAEVTRCAKEPGSNLLVISEKITEETNSTKKIELKTEGITVNSESSHGPVRKKFCPNLLQSHKIAENTLKPLVGSLIVERKPEKIQLGDETISSTKPLEDNISQIKPQYSCLKSSVEEVTEKSVKSVTQPYNGSKKLFHQNFKVEVNPNVISDVPGKKTLRVKITIDDTDAKKPKKHVNSEKEKKKEESLNKLLGKDTGSLPDDGVLSYELDNSDESNISDGKEIVIARDSAVERVSPLVSSPCRSSRLNNVKPNLATASTRFSPFNQLSYAQMNKDARRKFKLLYGDRCPDRSKMTMKDLIFYNPSSNPMSKESSENKDLLPETEVISNSDANQSDLNSEDTNTLNTDDEIEEEQVNADGNKAIDKDGVPVPQLKITADGKIIIAPESLVVKTKHDTAKKERRPLIVENDFTHHKIVKKKSVGEKKNWTFQETLDFYKFLHTTGSDFSRMKLKFPDRTRNSLKKKFKREEKLNGHLIDLVMPGRILTDEQFEAIKKELAVNKMWEEIEKCSRRRSVTLPEIPDISRGVTNEVVLSLMGKKNNIKTQDTLNKMWIAFEQCSKRTSDVFPGISDVSQGVIDDTFLSAVEKKNYVETQDLSNTSAEPEKNGTGHILLDEVPKLTKTSVKTKSNKRKPKSKRKVLRLKEYFSNKEDSAAGVQANINSLIHRVLEISKNDSESRPASDDEVMLVDEDMPFNKPIVVNTRIESSGIKYTKSITFNPSNLDNPLDINETISHNVQEYPTSAEIIDEIVNILSSDGQSPTINNLENGNNYYNVAKNNSDNSEEESVNVLNETIEK